MCKTCGCTKTDEPVDKPEECYDYALEKKEECDAYCPSCVNAKTLKDGRTCYECRVKKGDHECLGEGYYQDCSACKEGERCKNLGVMLFYQDRKSPLLNCYQPFIYSSNSI